MALKGYHLNDEPIEREKHQARESSEALTLEYEEKDFVDKHGCFILESPSPCFILSTKMLRRMVVDAYVYHKNCKFPRCTVALTLQLKHNR